MAAYGSDRARDRRRGYAGKASNNTSNNKSDKISYVLCHQPKSFDWRVRNAKPHALGQLHEVYFMQVRELLNQIIQLT